MTTPDEDYGRRERLLLHHSHQYPPPPHLSPTSPGQPLGDRYLPPAAPSPGERYIPPPAPAPSDRYHVPPAPAPSDRYLAPPNSGSGERYLSSSGDRYVSGDRYLPPSGPGPGERYLPPPAPAPGDRYIPPPAPAPADRYLQPPSAVSTDRYLSPPAPAPGERYLSPPTPTPGGPGDPYMRRDLGYHHHYRLPHPSYQHHISHQYHPHFHHHHQRTLPAAPHHRPSNYHSHHAMPSPNRVPIRCCPSPSHFGPASPGGSTPATPTASAANILSSVSSSTGGSHSPMLPHRGRTPPCGATQRILQPASSSSCAPNPVIEYVGASGGRHVTTPTPPPIPPSTPGALPRCASLSSCDDNPLCPGEVKRRGGCDPGSTMSLCCGSSRRFVEPITTPTLAAIPPALPSTPHHVAATTVWRAVSQQAASQGSPNASPSPADTPPPAGPTSSCPVSTASISTSTSTSTPQLPQQQAQPSSSTSHAGGSGPEHPVQRSLSAPNPSPHTADRVLFERRTNLSTAPSGTNPRPQYGRSISKTEAVKQYVKRETAGFFGVEENREREQFERWLNRRRRLASRTYGPLRDEHQPPRTPVTPQTPSASQPPREPLSVATRPDVLPAGRDASESGSQQAPPTPHWSEPPFRRKETVAQMTFGGLALVVSTLTRHRLRPMSRSRQWSRSYAPSAVPQEGTPTIPEEPSSPSLEDEVFFDKPLPAPSLLPQQPGASGDVIAQYSEVSTDGGFVMSRDQLDQHQPHVREQYRRPQSWRRTPERSETASESGPEVGCSRIWSRVLDRVFDNSNRRTYGMGVVGRFFGRSIKRPVATRKDIKEQLDDIEDHRPFFTYWVTTVQILILIISLFCYGFGPIGLDLNHRSGQVLVTSLSLQQVDYQEPANFWIGPRAADLIHLGAKFAPCMRKDAKIMKEIEKVREKERETACCIRNDDSGCVQSSQADCSKTISTWKKWTVGDAGPGGRISGSVCGLDPKYCEAPASVAPYEWPDDITKWPICRKTNSHPQQRSRYKDKMAEHMVCEVIGHPCCIGIHGMCRITTKEYCDFVRGYFHEEASLCSQVSCLDDVCGMVPFYSPDVPDQFYRLWTSLFLHAGIFQLIITLVIQYFLMRDLEKLTGSLRIMIIYMGSGVAGNLASSIFVPYRADVGPSGAQFGLLACLIVEVLNAWMMLKKPEKALFKLILITLVLFLFGLLPWIDNYAHLFGFIFGFLLSYALMPFISFGEYDRQKKVALIWVCLISSVILFGALVVLFYVIPVYDCEICSYFNCVSLTRDFCASQNINFMREEPVV